MDYTSIFQPIPWGAVGVSVLQTLSLYWLVLLGLKIVGRRVFAEMGPEDMIVLLLIAEACDLGLTVEGAGYWGAVFSVLSILLMGGLIERIMPLRQLIESSPVVLYKNGRLDHQRMRKNLVTVDDLEQVAREKGLASYTMFSEMILEGSGSISGILKRTGRGGRKNHSPAG